MKRSTPDSPAIEETAGEYDEESSRSRVVVLFVVGAVVAWRVVVAFPEVSYVVVGIIGTYGWQKGRGWLARRRGGEEGGEEETEELPETVAETLHRIAEPNAFLADFAVERGVTMDVARLLLEGSGIRVRRAVRNGESTAVGVHREDIPPLPRPFSAAPVGGVDQGQPTNQLTVEALGLAGSVVRDPAESSYRRGEVSDR